MTNLKKIGLTALAGTLASTASSYAGELTVSGTAQMIYDTNSTKTASTDATSSEAFTTNTSLFFSGSGELDNGYAVSVTQNLTEAGFSSGSMSVDMGDMGKLMMYQVTNAAGIASIQDKVPNAGEQVWDDNAATHGGPADGIVDPNGGDDVLGYTVSANGFTLSTALSFPGDGAETSAALTASGLVDGLTIGAGFGNDKQATTDDDLSTAFITYAAGPITIGAQQSKVEDDSASQDIERDAYGVTFAVNENLSVSYGVSDTDYDTSSKVDEENKGISASYTTGGMTVGLVNNSKDNANGTSGTNQETTEIKLTFAF